MYEVQQDRTFNRFFPSIENYIQGKGIRNYEPCVWQISVSQGKTVHFKMLTNFKAEVMVKYT